MAFVLGAPGSLLVLPIPLLSSAAGHARATKITGSFMVRGNG